MIKNLSKFLGVGILVGGIPYAQGTEFMGGDLTATIGVVSNYFFRGVTQTDDDAAIQGSIDWKHDSGFYIGTWLSNIDFGSEQDASVEIDIYTGYDIEMGEIGLGVNTIYYAYPDAGSNDAKDAGELDYWEIGGSASWRWVNAGLQYTVWGETSNAPFNNGDLYFYGGLDFEPLESWGIGLKIGRYEFDDGDDYTHWSATISREAGNFGTFSVNYEQTNGDDGDIPADTDDPKFWVGWNITF